MKEKNINRLISILYRHSQIYINYCLRDLGISSSEYIFMMALYNNEGISQEELSSFLLIDKAATTRAIKSLEEKGLVMRQKDVLDKRVNKVFITEKGNANKEKIYAVSNNWTDFLATGMDDKIINVVTNSLADMVRKTQNLNYKELVNNWSDSDEKN